MKQPIQTVTMGFLAAVRHDMRKYKEIIPLLGIMGVATVGVGCFSVYSFVSILGIGKGTFRECPPHEYIEDGGHRGQILYLTDKQKEFKNNPKLEELRRELGKYKVRDE